MTRGENWLVAGGVDASKPRPALIVQDDPFDTESVTVCPLTTTVVDAPLARLPVAADPTSGIARPSYVMIDKITTIRRRQVSAGTGRLTETQLIEFEGRAMVFLGFAG